MPQAFPRDINLLGARFADPHTALVSARVWKHLAGIDRLLTLAEQALDRNKAATCPNSLRSKPSGAGFSPSWKVGESLSR